nr:hypothetical protein Iba_chr15aCG8890 [Ipomoea batatas]
MPNRPFPIHNQSSATRKPPKHAKWTKPNYSKRVCYRVTPFSRLLPTTFAGNYGEIAARPGVSGNEPLPVAVRTRLGYYFTASTDIKSLFKSPLRIGSWRKGREVFISSDDYIKIKVKDHDKGGEHNNDDLQHLVSDVWPVYIGFDIVRSPKGDQIRLRTALIPLCSSPQITVRTLKNHSTACPSSQQTAIQLQQHTTIAAQSQQLKSLKHTADSLFNHARLCKPHNFTIHRWTLLLLILKFKSCSSRPRFPGGSRHNVNPSAVEEDAGEVDKTVGGSRTRGSHSTVVEETIA